MMLEKTSASAETLDDPQTADLLSLAGDQKRIGELIDVINDQGSSAEVKKAAIQSLNTVANFSPAVSAKLPELVNALRGQIKASDKPLRLVALSTLTAMKDEVAQNLLLRDLDSELAEKDRLVPTAAAISMIGRDAKALSASLLHRIARNPPSRESLVEAVRHMAGDADSFGLLQGLLEDDNTPSEVRTWIPDMIKHVNPKAFLDSAKKILEDKEPDMKLASAITRSIAGMTKSDGQEKLEETTDAVQKLMKSSPEAFKNLANKLLFKKGD